MMERRDPFLELAHYYRDYGEWIGDDEPTDEERHAREMDVEREIDEAVERQEEAQ